MEVTSAEGHRCSAAIYLSLMMMTPGHNWFSGEQWS